ncbi:ROK family protein [Carboxylicivirga caseinilyticus]|uniref:ROK family protein n=1 Tax=Carboxylicivirga caseinilyticus TaxID=3417572 RepID=UPI003D331E5D|nr:ROK family protein [Marinilabiliaceae bacterium A049]
MKIEVAIGIDIGGTNTVIGVVDREGNILAETSTPTLTNTDINNYLNTLTSKINETVFHLNGTIEVKGIGIGAPSSNYYTGEIVGASNLGWGDRVPFVKLMKEFYDYPVIVLTNDANSAAVGEMMYGAAKGMNDFIMLTLGTGVGSGIVANGKLILGHDGFAGELGHVIIDPNGRECGCGRKGCLETYASATGICRTASELIATTKTESKLRNVPALNFTSKMIYDAAVKGDELALKAFEITGKMLGKAIADFVTFSSPEAVFLFGGLAMAGDYIFTPTREAMEENMCFLYSNKVKLLPSKLDGAKIAILGASAVVWQEMKN